MMEADGLVALWKENSTLKNYLALHNLENIVVIVIKISEDAMKECFFVLLLKVHVKIIVPQQSQTVCWSWACNLIVARNTIKSTECKSI